MPRFSIQRNSFCCTCASHFSDEKNEGLSQRCRQIDFILILLVFTVNLEKLGSSQAKLSNFKFTTGEQLRYESTTCAKM